MTIPIPGLNHLTDDSIFIFSRYVMYLPWLVLMFAPKWSMRPPLVRVVVVIQCLIYVTTFASSLATGEGSMLSTFAEFGTLEGVIKVFQNPTIILPAWVHYLGYDLVVGNYFVEKNNAAAAGLPQAVMIPVLFFTCVAGPSGFLLYTVLQGIFSLMGTKGTTKVA